MAPDTSRWNTPGTAPRARGRLVHHEPHVHSAGNSPACAGTTATGSPTPAASSEQPRVRGDDMFGIFLSISIFGTAPRARGRRRRRLLGTQGHGNSPACAGTTRVSAGRRWRSGEQPRVRGDDMEHTPLTINKAGTAPRARGRLCHPGDRRQPVREQPRVRGDDPTRSLRAGAGTGTAPRARGRHEYFGTGGCGEGTAPRARGRQRRTVFQAGRGGNSPACAGTTAPPRPTPGGAREQPRVRGDDGSGRPAGPVWREQPRVRGDDGSVMVTGEPV